MFDNLLVGLSLVEVLMQKQSLSQKIEEHISERLYPSKKNTKLKNTDGAEDYEPKTAVLCTKDEINRWITKAAARANQIKFVTHAIKYTHSDAQGTSVNVKNYKHVDCDDSVFYITSFSLKNLKIDAVGNAAVLDVAKFLKIENEKKTLIDLIAEGDYSALQFFASSEDQLISWVTGFKKTLETKSLESHVYSKQVYFPIGKEQYHILSPLFSTSLATEFYEKVQRSKFGEEEKTIREAKRKSLYSQYNYVSYPNMAILSVGGSKPQNISLLNTNRKGKIYLLNCEPPIWKKIAQPPIKQKSIFFNEYDRRVYSDIKAFKTYLIEVKDKASTKKIRDMHTAFIDKLMDALIVYAAEIQNMEDKKGWSKDSALPQSQKFWLDPYRGDLDFQEERDRDEWQEKVAKQFSMWLMSKLKSEVISLGETEYHYFRVLFEDKLNLLKNIL